MQIMEHYPYPLEVIGFLLLQQNTMPQKQVGEERVDLAYTSRSWSIIEGTKNRNSNRAGSWRQELMQRPWRGATYRFALHGLFSLLSYRTQDHQPRDGPPTMDWALPVDH